MKTNNKIFRFIVNIPTIILVTISIIIEDKKASGVKNKHLKQLGFSKKEVRKILK